MKMFQKSAQKKRDELIFDNEGECLGSVSSTGVAIASGVAGTVVASVASAAPVDLTALTTAVDFSTTTTAILGVAGTLIVVYIAWKAAKMVVAAVRGM